MKKLIKNVLSIVKLYKKYEILGFLLTILYTVAVFLSPIVSKLLIDDVIPSKSKDKLLIGIAIFFGGCICQPIFAYLKDKVFMYITENVTIHFRKNMFNKVIHAPMEFFDRNNSGAIVSRISNDGRNASDFVTNFFVVYIKNILLIIMIVFGMLFLSKEITALVLALFIIYFVVNWKISKKFTSLSRDMQQSYDNMCIKINHTVHSINTIKAFMLEDKVKEEFSDIVKKAYSINMKYRSLSILMNSIGNAIMITSLTIVYGIGSLFVMRGDITIGTIVAIGLYFQLLVQPVYELLNNNISINSIIPIFERINEYTNLKVEKEEGKNIEINQLEGLELENVRFKYQNGLEAINEINLKLPSTGMVAIVGDSGSGKSTLTKLLNGFYDSYEGFIKINGIDTRELEVKQIRQIISLVSQDTELLNKSISENLKIGKEVDDAKIQEVLELLNLNSTIDKLENGYDTIINERANLSGGEKQRISIARAILKESLIYIFDEPTSALDSINEMEIKKILETLSKNKLVLIITHNLNLLNQSDYIYVMRQGKFVEEGNYDFLKDKKGYFYKFIKNRNKESAISDNVVNF